VLPNVLVEGIRRAVEVSSALKVYVCNVATQHGETDSFTVSDHYRLLKEHLNGARVIKSDVVAEENRYRHDSKKLADALIRLYYERNQMSETEPVAEEDVVEPQRATVG
jgi:2-phospho-L-lactate transferase/gluconeogenesis factor (CofD/UPF0052 family)